MHPGPGGQWSWASCFRVRGLGAGGDHHLVNAHGVAQTHGGDADLPGNPLAGAGPAAVDGGLRALGPDGLGQHEGRCRWVRQPSGCGAPPEFPRQPGGKSERRPLPGGTERQSPGSCYRSKRGEPAGRRPECGPAPPRCGRWSPPTRGSLWDTA